MLSIKIPKPIRVDRLTLIMLINRVDLYVHWSVFLIAAIMLSNAVRQPLVTLVGLVCYLSVLFIHECGHMIAARRKGCEVESIKIYPIFAITSFQTPWSRFDHCVIAWGGVVAQAVIAIPVVAWIAVFGYTPFEPVNAALAILGPFSLGIAAFNLWPAAPLDGAIAWGLIPESIKRLRMRRDRNATGWKSRK
jgi:membrane-associated protease RseP (regulator of RpoE activity)